MIPDQLWQVWDFLFSRNPPSLCLPQSMGFPEHTCEEGHITEHLTIEDTQWMKCHQSTGSICPQRWAFSSVLFLTSMTRLFSSYSSVFIFWMLLMVLIDSFLGFPCLNSWKNLIALFNHHFCCCRTLHTTGSTWQNGLAAFIQGVDCASDQRAENKLCGRKHGCPHSRNSPGLFPLSTAGDGRRKPREDWPIQNTSYILHSTTLSNTEMSPPRRFKKDIAACATTLNLLADPDPSDSTTTLP